MLFYTHMKHELFLNWQIRIIVIFTLVNVLFGILFLSPRIIFKIEIYNNGIIAYNHKNQFFVALTQNLYLGKIDDERTKKYMGIQF